MVTCNEDSMRGNGHLQVNMLLLLLSFFSSSGSCSGELRLFSSFTSLMVCRVISDSSSLGSGLGVSGSGVWKLQNTAGRTWALKPEQAAFDRTKPRTSHTLSTHTCSQWWYLLASWSDLALCFHHPQKAEGLRSPHAVALGTGPESLPSGFHTPEKHKFTHG